MITSKQNKSVIVFIAVMLKSLFPWCTKDSGLLQALYRCVWHPLKRHFYFEWEHICVCSCSLILPGSMNRPWWKCSIALFIESQHTGAHGKKLSPIDPHSSLLLCITVLLAFFVFMMIQFNYWSIGVSFNPNMVCSIHSNQTCGVQLVRVTD